MVWQVLAVLALVFATSSLWLVAGALRRLAVRDPLAVHPLVRRALFVREISAETVTAFARARPGRERIAFIANPTKAGVLHVREAAYRGCSMRYLPEPMWLYTTLEESGTRLANEAIEAGADVLVAVGGDGTVRAVAEAAVAAKVPFGIIPMGTGNLMARNLGMSLGDHAQALRAVLDGQEHLVDVGWLTVTRDDGVSDDHIFLVVAGVGIDAEMVAGAHEGLKSRLGWVAYFVAGLKHLGAAKRMRASVAVDHKPAFEATMRTVLIANCGRLPGGVTLVPNAKIDDGSLDIATIDARGGVAGWAELFGEVILQGEGREAPTLPTSWRVGRIDHVRARSVEVSLESPQRVQVDGESLGRAMRVAARVVPHALRMRTMGPPS